MKIPKSIQADLSLILITFIWGSTFTIVKQALEHISPILFLALRFWIATIAIVAFVPFRTWKMSRKTIWQGLVLSLVMVGGFVFQTLGLRSTGPSHSAFITSLSVLLVPLFGFLIFHHRPRPQTIAGVILATIGLVLLLADISVLRMRSGDILTLICAVIFGFQILFLGRFVSSSDYRPLILLQISGTAVLCSVAAPFFEKPFIVWNSAVVMILFVTGIFATAFAFSVQAWAQKLTTANHAALIFSLEPFFAALFAFWILDQVLTAREWMGGILVLPASWYRNFISNANHLTI